MSLLERDEVALAFRAIQARIVQALEELDGAARFGSDEWGRGDGGGGLSRAVANGALLSKGGVNFSEVHGPLSQEASKALRIEADAFYATGVSIVLHAVSPWVPTIHMNVRYFESSDACTGARRCWFGGGIDLTPVYVVPDEARIFHQCLKAVCDAWDPTWYDRFKPWADDYFFLPHRAETRGVGGIFYDRLEPSTEEPLEKLFGFTCAVGDAFSGIYARAVERGREQPYSQRELEWQRIRRGRYVEFNLVHDRGTRFGLETGGRTESILMSLPPSADWQYDHRPAPGSAEAETLAWLRKGVDWLAR